MCFVGTPQLFVSSKTYKWIFLFKKIYFNYLAKHFTSTIHLQYQQDVFAFAKQLKVKGTVSVIPHCPFLMKESKQRYAATYNSISMKKFEKAVGKKVDMNFWPATNELFSESEYESSAGCGGCC